jgi:hypothetical protein
VNSREEKLKMSEESTAAIAELAQLERDLKAGAQPKPVQLVNNPPQPAHWPVGYIQGDPNHTRAEIEHPTPVRDRLRAAVADPNTSEQDCQAARETLRISFHE